MSDNPYAAPESAASASAFSELPMSPNLPTIVKALAIIALCLGGFNIFGGICGIAGMAVATAVTNSPQIQQQMEKDNSRSAEQFRKSMSDMTASLPVFIVQIGMTIVASVGLIAGGIGVLRRREWGRKMMVGSCVLYIALTIFSWIYALFTSSTSLEGMDSMQQTGTIVGLVLSIAFGLIFLAFYAFTAYFFSQKRIRPYFQ